MKTYRSLMAFIPLAAVALVGCSAGEPDPAPSFDNETSGATASAITPSATATASPTASASPSTPAPTPVDRGTLSENQVNGIVDTMAKIKDEGNTALHQSSDAVKGVLNQYLFGNEQAINWITLMAQGGSIDPNSLTGEATGKFTGNIVDSDGTVLAYVTGVYQDGKISPVHYEQTTDGDNFREAHKSDAAEWATN